MAGKGPIFEVEKILKMRSRPGKSNEYYIHWSGYSSDDDSWEPEEHLLHCEEILVAFKKVNAPSSPRSGRKATPGRKIVGTAKSPSRSRQKSPSRRKSPGRVTSNSPSRASKSATKIVTQAAESRSGSTTSTRFIRTEKSISTAGTPTVFQRPSLRTRLDLRGAGDATVTRTVTTTTSTSSSAKALGSKPSLKPGIIRRIDIFLLVLFVLVGLITIGLIFLKPEEQKQT